MSIGGESIPFTMQVEVSHEAPAADALRPDEPGMVRIPITLNVMIPSHLLAATRTAAGASGTGAPSAAADPGADGRHRRGRFPGSAGSATSASSFRTMLAPAANEGGAAFRDMLKATRSGQRQSAPTLPVVEPIDSTDVELPRIVARSSSTGAAQVKPAAALEVGRDEAVPPASGATRASAIMVAGDPEGVHPAAASGGLGSESVSPIGQAGQFAHGFGQGLRDGAPDTVEGFGSLATGAYALATSADARQQSWSAAVEDTQSVGHFVRTALTDPKQAVGRVVEATSSAGNKVSAAYRQAEARGNGTEFLGMLAGQGSVLAMGAMIPGGAEAEVAEAVGDVGRATEIAKVASASASEGSSTLGTTTEAAGAVSDVEAGESEVVGGASNPTTVEAHKDGLRAAMTKPATSDPDLKAIMDDLYRDRATIGSGSTAAAVRHELATGERVKGAFHSVKAVNTIRTLNRWLRNNPTASPGDRAAAENVIITRKTR
ncbi:hypothetical protein [Lichenicoccus sp.]|uniref:hypothetical protein n=1 Tax=Lichenicoccus sp. TaxID=2781899 RepID=UPI003D0CCE5A